MCSKLIFDVMCYWFSGPFLERVRRVQLHSSILGKWCMHPSIFRPVASFRLFWQIFPTNRQIMHPSIEISSRALFLENAFKISLPRKEKRINWFIIETISTIILSKITFFAKTPFRSIHSNKSCFHFIIEKNDKKMFHFVGFCNLRFFLKKFPISL